MNIRPLQDRILIKKIEQEQVTSSGIIIPDSAKETPAEGQVVAVGPGRKDGSGNLIEMIVKVDDKIVFTPYGDATVVKIDGVDYLMLREADVMGIIE